MPFEPCRDCDFRDEGDVGQSCENTAEWFSHIHLSLYLRITVPSSKNILHSRYPENVGDEVVKTVRAVLNEEGFGCEFRDAVRDVLAEGDGEPAFYPRPSRGGGYSGGDGGGAAYQC